MGEPEPRSLLTTCLLLGACLLGACLVGGSPLGGCAARPTPQPAEVCPYALPGGGCAGVTAPTLCHAADYCVAGVTCGRTWRVDDDAARAGGNGTADRPLATLEQAAARAVAGDCIALADGTYTGARLAGGVSLLGKGAEHVTIGPGAGASAVLAIDPGGRGGLLTGFTLTGQAVGLALGATAGTRVEQVVISGVRGVGIDARGARELTLRQVEVGRTEQTTGRGAQDPYGIGVVLAERATSTVRGLLVRRSGTIGLLVHGAALALRRSAVIDSASYGVAVDCGAGCSGLPATTIDDSVLERSGGIGLLALGARVALSRSQVGRTAYSRGFACNVQAQGGQLALTGSKIYRSHGQGVVLHGTTGTLRGNRVERNEAGGLVVREVGGAAVGGTALLLEDNRVEGNQQVGIAVVDSRAVVLRGGSVSETSSRAVVTELQHARVGDGLQLLDGTTFVVERVRIERSARLGLLIDGSSGTVREVVIGASEVPLVVQRASLASQVIRGVTDPDGGTVAPVVPPSPYPVGG